MLAKVRNNSDVFDDISCSLKGYSTYSLKQIASSRAEDRVVSGDTGHLSLRVENIYPDREMFDLTCNLPPEFEVASLNYVMSYQY